ncbi:sirohydrochlorin chelatase [Streptomyces sp. NPDC018031]|uniref:sirohydrochlorin chelatase n=1 Tax=Streptomyces sp. NPDC018031 TaxID=3365033 RepID=UPI0037BD62D4
MTTPPALLLAGHGIRDESAAAALRAFTREFGARHPGIRVAGGAAGTGPGPAADAAAAVAALAGDGATRIVAVPLSLAPDARLHQQIAGALATGRAGHGEVRCVTAEAVGAHPALLGVLERRLDEALGGGARTPSDRAATTVLLVGAGSVDPAGNAEVHRIARLLWEGRGYAGVECAFVSLAAPDVVSGLDRCARLGARRVVLLPVALFAGGPTERAWAQAEGWALARPEVQVVRAEPVGPVEELMAAVLERYAAAAGGPAPRPGVPDTAPGAGSGTARVR